MRKFLAENRRAKFDYEILETLEAGIILSGQEVKSAKEGHMSLKGAYVTVNRGEAFLINAQISPYKKAGRLEGFDPRRSRKLLLTKKEIKRLSGKLKEKGLTLVPLSAYNKHGFIKIEIALGKGKAKIDKREKIRKREADRKIRRVLRGKI